ncbi:hypothetical protein [Arthrobacter sp. K5]|uniref:Uncharacterized protein n=1 Tax=Arthrobacter sp. K5 TaxID=2839623 RepID=A0AAU8EYP3_9MICC
MNPEADTERDMRNSANAKLNEHWKVPVEKWTPETDMMLDNPELNSGPETRKNVERRRCVPDQTSPGRCPKQRAASLPRDPQDRDVIDQAPRAGIGKPQ